MPLIRLIGLTLFITAIFLALVSAITKTSHIRVQMPGAGAPLESGQGNAAVNPPAVYPPAITPGVEALPLDQDAAFTSVPIVWPLLMAAGAGLLMWFMHPVQSFNAPRTISKRRTKRR